MEPSDQRAPPRTREIVGARHILAMFGVGLLPFFFYQPEFNASYHFVFRYLAIPALLVGYIVLFWRNRGVRGLGVSDWLRTGMIVLIFLACLGGVVLLPNALIGQQRTERIEGKVVRQFRTTGRNKTYGVEVERLPQHDTVSFEVRKATYDTLTPGSDFQRVMTRGSLGVLYRSRF
jgi:hypothetical protein